MSENNAEAFVKELLYKDPEKTNYQRVIGSSACLCDTLYFGPSLHGYTVKRIYNRLF